jgi:hypothetical protein
LLGGSLAAGQVDYFSDIDLYAFVWDDDFESAFAEREAIANSWGSVLFHYLGDHMPAGKYQLIVWYEGPLHLDLMFRKWPETAPHWKWRNSIILNDSGGVIARLKSESDLLQSPDLTWEQLSTLNQKFWGWVAYTFGMILRGELWEALDNIAWIRNERCWSCWRGHKARSTKVTEGWRRSWTIASLWFSTKVCAPENRHHYTQR